MARNLALKTNVEPADSDYPYGKIKDDSGVGDGTPVNELVYGDMHQFFARMFAKSGLVYNNLPDSDYSDFQFFEAAQKLWKNFIGVRIISTNTNTTVADIGKVIFVSGATGSTSHYLPNSTTLQDGDSIVFVNNDDKEVNILNFGGDSLANYTSPLLKTGDFIQLVLDKANAQWIVINHKITQIIPSPVIISYASGTSIITVGNTALKLLPNAEISDIDNQYSSGNFTPNKVGFYNFSAVLTFYISAVSTNETVYFQLLKNSTTLVNRCSWVKTSYDGNGLVLTATLSTVINAVNVTDTYQVVVLTLSNRAIEIDGTISYHYVNQ